MTKRLTHLSVVVPLLLISCLPHMLHAQEVSISGTLQTWHRVTLTFDGPKSSETATPNPFRDYRLFVIFRNGETAYTVPGFFAADGNAAETGATSGTKWRVHFTPNAMGKWTYTAHFHSGKDIALREITKNDKAMAFNGTTGFFQVTTSDKKGRDFRGKGMLQYVGEHYLQFAHSKDYFLKGGADSPENFLGYADFDDTKPRHRYEPHLRDWRPGDPTWKTGKGKGIIGALNYLADQGMNSVYFLTMNVQGDGKDVWPWTDLSVRDRFDCSKLDQWEIVFSHMDKLGLMLHIITQETENDQLLNKGALGLERKLYYRELIARFGHHLAITWNLGEENTNTDAQRKQFCEYIHNLDAYDHPVVCHTFPGQYDKVYTPLLGYRYIEGPSLQTNDTHNQTQRWVERSTKANRKWVVCLDEIGPANTGVKPDKDDPQHDEVRKKHLWGNLMAGGAGCEWYFGYKYAHNDLNCEDFRSRANMWKQTRIALEFFHNHLPFPTMKSMDGLTTDGKDYVFADVGNVYVIYLPNGGTTKLKLAKGKYTVRWYDPRNSGELMTGTVRGLEGDGLVSVGEAPHEKTNDWVVLIRRE